MAESIETPFATLYTITTFPYARIMKALAAANFNNLTLKTAPDFEYGKTNTSPEYIAKFPHGKIPALETPSGFCLAEAAAIAHYVADSGPARDQLLGRTIEERALVQMWISFSDHELFSTSSPILGLVTGRQKTVSPEFAAEKEVQFMRALRRLETQLQGGKKFLVRDDECSLGDLSVASALYWPLKYFLGEKEREGFPKVMEWWERLMGVEGVGEAFQAPMDMCAAKPEFGGKQ